MPIQHTNRRGDVYYLHQGKTKTGKPKWHFSMKEPADPVDVIPDGYEIYESPGAQVYLRKHQPKLIRDEEVALVEKALRDRAKLTYFIVELKGKDIIVQLSNQEQEFLEPGPFARIGMPIGVPPSRIQRFLSYSPMMMFKLIDAKTRQFAAYRWCFLGAIDNWIHLDGQGSLGQLC